MRRMPSSWPPSPLSAPPPPPFFPPPKGFETDCPGLPSLPDVTCFGSFKVTSAHRDPSTYVLSEPFLRVMVIHAQRPRLIEASELPIVPSAPTPPFL